MGRDERRLAAILAADVAGYSRLMSADESGTLARFNVLRSELIDPKIAQFKGRVVGTAGDSLLVEFGSAVDAVQCAVEAQEWIAIRNADIPEDRRIVFRMGINLGDVIAEGATIHGDGVNVASRLERLAEPGTVVIGRSIRDQVTGKLPYTYADLGEHAVKNIPAPVRAFRVELDVRPAVVAPIKAQDLPLPSKPSVAVLPFTNMSGDPEQEYFSDGITEDIITELSRNRGLFVIARNSSFVFKGPAVDIGEVGRKLGVRYVVEGSVRKAGKRIRITAQLIEAATGNHVWAERYDRDLEDIFSVQDEVTERIVWALASNVAKAEMIHARTPRHTNLGAYDVMLRGIELFHRYSPSAAVEAISLFNQAADIDPTSGTIVAWGARARMHVANFMFDSRENENALIEAQKALTLGEDDGAAEAVIGFVMGLRGAFDSAEAYIERAIQKNPNRPSVHSTMGHVRLWQGRAPEARDIAMRLGRLDPLAPAWNSELLGCAYYILGDYRAAVDAFVRCMPSQFSMHYAYLAASLGQCGRAEDARAAWHIFRDLSKGLSLLDFHGRLEFPNREDRDHWLAGLRKAGITE